MIDGLNSNKYKQFDSLEMIKCNEIIGCTIILGFDKNNNKIILHKWPNMNYYDNIFKKIEFELYVMNSDNFPSLNYSSRFRYNF